MYVRNDNLSAVVIADTEYPQRVCFTLLDKVRMKFFYASSYGLNCEKVIKLDFVSGA